MKDFDVDAKFPIFKEKRGAIRANPKDFLEFFQGDKFSDKAASHLFEELHNELFSEGISFMSFGMRLNASMAVLSFHKVEQEFIDSFSQIFGRYDKLEKKFQESLRISAPVEAVSSFSNLEQVSEVTSHSTHSSQTLSANPQGSDVEASSSSSNLKQVSEVTSHSTHSSQTLSANPQGSEFQESLAISVQVRAAASSPNEVANHSVNSSQTPSANPQDPEINDFGRLSPWCIIQ